MRQGELQVLERLLQERLQTALPKNVSFQVRCAVNPDALMILAQHSADVMPDPQPTLRVLEQTIKLLQPDFINQDRVHLYLRVTGQKQPYVSHGFPWQPATESAEGSILVEQMLDDEQEVLSQELVGAGVGDLRQAGSRRREQTRWQDSDQETASSHASVTVDSGEQLSPETSDEEVDNTPTSAESRWQRPSQKVLLIGAGVSLVFFLSSLYVLTRPCVVGLCREIPAAKALNQQATRTLQRPRTGEEILRAQQQLERAVQLLKTIPFWSGQHQIAQNQLEVYQGQAQLLEQLVTGLKSGATAAQKSQSPPYTPAEWGEIQQLWREAITLLEAVPSTGNVNQLKQQKLKDYRANLAAINWRLTAEQQANDNLETAKEAVKVADVRQAMAQSQENWQLAYLSWKTAINRLKGIPQGTTAYAEAQQMLLVYQPKLSAAYGRQIQEKTAANTYKQAINLARFATTSQQREQWSLAVKSWRNAINYAKNVPEGTFFYNNAQPLIGSYTGALKQAEVKLREVTTLQQAQNDLNQTCSGTPRLCDFAVTTQLIRVQMTPTYMQTLDQTVIAAQSRGDNQTQNAVLKHVQVLADALKAISNNAKIPLEVYAPDGYLMRKHNP